MHYMLLIYDDETKWLRMSDDERDGLLQEYFDFTDDLRIAGAYVDSAPLQPTSSGAAVRMRDGEQLVTDGPFAETKEQLGGYYLIEADSLEEAAAWAARIPSARFGTIEVRPIAQIPAPEEVAS